MPRHATGFLAIFTLALLIVPLAADAQPARLPRIGSLALRAGLEPGDEVFKQGLRDLGWIEGQNLAIEYRWAAGKVDHLPALAEELALYQHYSWWRIARRDAPIEQETR